MSISSSRLGPVFVLAALCLSGRTAHAQAPMTYWIPNLPVAFGGDLTVGQSLDGTNARGGRFSSMRYNFPNGWFVGGEGGAIGFGMNGINQDGVFGSSRYYQGVQFGYNFQNAGGLPITVFAGVDTLKYNPGIGGLSSSFDTVSGTLPGYGVHAGVEFQPTPNVSLSLGFGFTQQSGGIDSSGINSLSLSGASPFALGGRR
jgi:opacity protein-like surface antigen